MVRAQMRMVGAVGQAVILANTHSRQKRHRDGEEPNRGRHRGESQPKSRPVARSDRQSQSIEKRQRRTDES